MHNFHIFFTIFSFAQFSYSYSTEYNNIAGAAEIIFENGKIDEILKVPGLNIFRNNSNAKFDILNENFYENCTQTNKICYGIYFHPSREEETNEENCIANQLCNFGASIKQEGEEFVLDFLNRIYSRDFGTVITEGLNFKFNLGYAPIKAGGSDSDEDFELDCDKTPELKDFKIYFFSIENPRYTHEEYDNEFIPMRWNFDELKAFCHESEKGDKINEHVEWNSLFEYQLRSNIAQEIGNFEFETKDAIFYTRYQETIEGDTSLKQLYRNCRTGNTKCYTRAQEGCLESENCHFIGSKSESKRKIFIQSYSQLTIPNLKYAMISSWAPFDDFGEYSLLVCRELEFKDIRFVILTNGNFSEPNDGWEGLSSVLLLKNEERNYCENPDLIKNVTNPIGFKNLLQNGLPSITSYMGFPYKDYPEELTSLNDGAFYYNNENFIPQIESCNSKALKPLIEKYTILSFLIILVFF